MSSMRTRRQSRKLEEEDSPNLLTPSPQNGHANGGTNGRAKSPKTSRSKSPKTTKSNGPKENIFLFWPNVIGYSRIVLALASLYYMPLHPRTCSLLYSVSCILDALDGIAARYFEQSTRFGAVLDMVTDRCTTACLLVFLSSAWPRWSLLFQGLISLDLASHYMHMYATLVMGGQGNSHKNVDSSRSKILHLYYTNKNVLFAFCALNELFFIALYLLSFSSPILSPALLQPPSAPPASAQPGNPAFPKTSSLFPNQWSAGALELARANKMDSTVPWILAVGSSPIMLGKQIINVVQLVKASRWLAEGDVQMRRAQGLPRKRK